MCFCSCANTFCVNIHAVVNFLSNVIFVFLLFLGTIMGRFAPGNSGSTFGILEIGGASHQNTFENPSKETIALTVAGKPYHVISKRCISLLGVI